MAAILAMGGVDVNSFSSAGLSPLIAAAESGSVGVVKLLLQASAAPNAPASASGNYPLRAAIAGGDGECILELINAGADVNYESARGTPLATAAGLGDAATIALLVG